jgi:hypothetical protein
MLQGDLFGEGTKQAKKVKDESEEEGITQLYVNNFKILF